MQWILLIEKDYNKLLDKDKETVKIFEFKGEKRKIRKILLKMSKKLRQKHLNELHYLQNKF